MTRRILGRLAQLPLVLLVIYTLTLILAWAVPGNPLDRPEGRRPPAEVIEALQRRYNLDSFWGFYGSYLYSATGAKWAVEELDGTAQDRRARFEADSLAPPPARVFDLGPSLGYRDWSVNDVLAGALPVSMLIGATAIAMALVLGVLAGVIGAVRPNGVIDGLTLMVALVGVSLPTFVIGTVLLILFPVWLGLGAVGRWGSPVDVLLPSLTLSLPFAAYIARLTRLSMVEVLWADYVRTARAKGVTETGVVMRHALKNAFLPVLSYLGPATALAMTGSFVIERVFSVPGLGQHFVEAVRNKDLFLIIGVVLVFSTMLIVFNLIVDVLYGWFDPRIEG